MMKTQTDWMALEGFYGKEAQQREIMRTAKGAPVKPELVWESPLDPAGARELYSRRAKAVAAAEEIIREAAAKQTHE